MIPPAEPVPTQTLHAEACELGEGPTYDPSGDTAWWFDILGRTLFEHRFRSGETLRHALPVMGSQLSFVDERRQLLASDEGLFVRNVATGALSFAADIESADAATRSNDGRTHPSGALWIGTMGRKAERGAGAIYWFRGGEVRRLFGAISIPNAICFSPDGRWGYFTDTIAGHLMRAELDPDTGLPVAEATSLHDTHGENGGLDGAVVDADGVIWVARWGASAVTAFAPDGTALRQVAVPARQASCPAFVGPNLDRMLVTTARENMDEAQRARDPNAGQVFLLDFPMRGRFDPRVVL